MKIFASLLLGVVCLAPVFGQTETATVTGAITDASSAVVPGATITLRNTATGLAYNSLSNESGNYAVPALPPGTYEIKVTAAGFATATRAAVTLNVKARLELDFSLRPGDVKESVEISANAPILESETASVSQLVDNKTIVTLPLNGRNYSQLALLSPGASPNIGSRATDGFTINGARTFQNSYLIDGVDNNSYILGADTSSTQAIRPSVDAVQEFRIETSSYTAEFGRAQGGVISVSIKSGSNQFHGSAFEFLRNDKLDANNFFSNRAGLSRPPLKRNQFGGTLGGPVIKNRTFIFGSFQGTRFRQPTTNSTAVPTIDQANGNFGSLAVYDPANVIDGLRQQFPGNQIPAARLDPVARKLVSLYPAPNRAGAVNYTANIVNKDDENEGDLRVDHHFSNSDNMFLRFSRYGRVISQGSLFPGPGYGGNAFGEFPLEQSPTAYSVVVNETHVFTPILVNEFRVAFTRNESNQDTPSTEPLFAQYGIRNLPSAPGMNGLPTFTLTGFSTLGDRTFTPNPKLSAVRQLIDNVSWLRGGHSMKFGGDIRMSRNSGNSANVGRGSFTFNGQFTSRIPGQGSGSSMADFLLGQTSAAQIATPLRGDFFDNYYGLFFSDSWKVNRKLTLTLGLRYELQTPFIDRHDNQGSFDLNPANPTYGTVVLAKPGSILSRSFSNLEKKNFGPRVGFAWQLDSKTVIRGAGGIFYGGYGYLGIGQLGTSNVPFFVSITVASASTAARSSVVLADGFAAGVLNPANAVNPAATTVPFNYPLPHVYQGNFGIQRELPGQLVLTTSWVGSGSSFLAGQTDPNQPPPGAGAVNPRRPFPRFGAINFTTPFAHSTYQSLQTKLEKRFSRGLSLLSSYTWSHAIDNSVNGEDIGNGATLPQDPNNFNAEKASSSIDQRHRFVTSAIYEPRLARFAGNGAVARLLLDGWVLGGIFTAASGPPMTVIVTPNTANTTGTTRPNALRDANLPRDQRTPDLWFDPSAFAAAPSFAYGNAGRNTLTGPGVVNLDALFGRNFVHGERYRIEFRGELYNFTNSVHFARPALNVGLRTVGQIGATQIPNRQVQLGLRFAF